MSFSISFHYLTKLRRRHRQSSSSSYTGTLEGLSIYCAQTKRERARRLTREQWKSTLLTRPFILFLSLYLFHCAKAQNAAFFSLQRWSEFKHNCSNQRCMLKCLVLTQYLCKTWTDRLLTPKLQQIIPYLILI